MADLRSCALALALIGASGCEYLGGIGLLFGEWREEEREKAERLEQCGECGEGLRCNLLVDPGECRPDPGVEGDRCGSWKDREDPEHTFACASAWPCNQALDPPRCAAPGAVGQPCHITEHCAEGLYCSSQELVCRPAFAPGASCMSPEECRPLTCHVARGNVCGAPSNLGEPCSNGMDCAGDLGCSDLGKCFDPLAAAGP